MATGTKVISPYLKAKVAALSDTVDLTPKPTRAIYVGVAGDVVAILADDTTQVTFKALPVGIHPLRVKRIFSTGTAATNILALY